MPVLRSSRLVLRTAIAILLLIAMLWAAAALWIGGPEPRALAGALAGAVLLVAALAAALGRPWWRAAVAVFVPFAAVLAWWLTLAPSNERDWPADVAKLPTATVEGSLLTVRNLRNFAYRSKTDFTERWETRTYDLDALVGVDVFISFWGPTLYGHTIVSWAFADGRHLAVSIETPKERGEQNSALRGFFRQFELYYVVADERDLITLRTNHRGERVELYRTAASPVDRALLLDYVREMNALAAQPRWYNDEKLRHKPSLGVCLRDHRAVAAWLGDLPSADPASAVSGNFSVAYQGWFFEGPSSDMPGRFRPPMEHSHVLDQTWRNALGLKVDHVALPRVAVEPLGDVRTRFPQLRVATQPVETAQQGIDVPIGLLKVPLFGGVDPDLGEIHLRPYRKPIDHFLASRSRPAALIRPASFGNSSAS
jgi:hypothetical protein